MAWMSAITLPGVVPINGVSTPAADPLLSPTFLSLDDDFPSPIPFGEGTQYLFAGSLVTAINRAWTFRGWAQVNVSGTLSLPWVFYDESDDGTYGDHSFSFERSMTVPTALHYGQWSQFSAQPKPARTGYPNGALASNVSPQAAAGGAQHDWEFPVPASGVGDFEEVVASLWTFQIYVNAYGNPGMVRYRDPETDAWRYPAHAWASLSAVGQLTEPDALNPDQDDLIAFTSTINPSFPDDPTPRTTGEASFDADYLPEPVIPLFTNNVSSQGVEHYVAGEGSNFQFVRAVFTGVSITFSEPFNFATPPAL